MKNGWVEEEEEEEEEEGERRCRRLRGTPFHNEALFTKRKDTSAVYAPRLFGAIDTTTWIPFFFSFSWLSLSLSLLSFYFLQSTLPYYSYHSQLIGYRRLPSIKQLSTPSTRCQVKVQDRGVCWLTNGIEYRSSNRSSRSIGSISRAFQEFIRGVYIIHALGRVS